MSKRKINHEKLCPSPMAKTWTENGVLCCIDQEGRNIMYNERAKEWVRIDEIVWLMFGSEDQDGREIIHIDGNVRNDAISNLALGE